MSPLCWEEDVNLREYNTFNVDSIARYLVRIRSIHDLKDLLASPRFRDFRHLVIGGGSNILFAAENFDGVILKNEICGIEVVSENENNTVLRVGGGVEWMSLVTYCIDHDLGGLENLSLIPGTVGAAPIQNIGAYGAELSDVMLSVEVCNLETGETRTMSKDECALKYHDSIFKHALKYAFISSVTIRVSKAQFHCLNTQYSSVQDVLQQQGVVTPTIRSVSQAICLLRRRKLPDPKILGNAGSFFKNATCDTLLCKSIMKAHPEIPSFPGPDSFHIIPAAWLIENCGWKGKQIGEVGVSPSHALVLVNYGGARGREIVLLADSIIKDVQAKLGFQLIPEVNIIR
ncbi:hypothetical protein N7481_006587 [Penicillium waksmanii]|uniref:uncharacterized protein n=1 Tax=Penicillium waksmanii TaxID=69791 RepID=UPI00254843DA|nr:uncharacterized protein N7481_006587 [Penicillium waksmanii]KAJ5984488.1 hypothetical protein N7481_006587 [Penicillium waksmanii]